MQKKGGIVVGEKCYVKQDRCAYSREKEWECYLTSEELKKENCQAKDNSWDSKIGCVKRPEENCGRYEEWNENKQSCEYCETCETADTNPNCKSDCEERVNGKCRGDEDDDAEAEEKCCSDGQITLTFKAVNSQAESRCFTPLQKIWDLAKTQQTLKRICNDEEECNKQAKELGVTYMEFKDGAPCRLPEDELVKKHLDDMKKTCIDEGLRWNPILKQCDNNCEEKFTKWMSIHGQEGGEICDTRVSLFQPTVAFDNIKWKNVYEEFSCAMCKYGSLRVGLNDVCCSMKDKSCSFRPAEVEQEFDSDKLSDKEKAYVEKHDMKACLSKRYPPQWDTFDFPSWREGECGKWTKDAKPSEVCLSDYQKFLTSQGKVHNSISACEMAGGYPEYVSDAWKDNENYIYDSGKYYKCIFPVTPQESAGKCIEDELKQHVSDLLVPTELTGLFNNATKKCGLTGTSENNIEDWWHSFTDGEGNRDKAEFRLGERACYQLDQDDMLGDGSKAGSEFDKKGYCTYNKSPKSCDVRRDMKGEAPEFKDTRDDSCEFCLHGFKTTAKGNKMTQELWKSFSAAETFDRDDFEDTLTDLIEKNYEGKSELEGTKKVVKMLGGKVMWKGIFSSGLMKDNTKKYKIA